MATISVIALVGQAGAGKSEVAKHLVANHDYVRVRFAGILKDMCKVLGLTDQEIEGAMKEVPSSLLLGQTPRHAMQTLGTEWGRDLIHPDLWAHAWKIKVTQKLLSGHKIVCDDCRFVNEADTVNTIHPSEIWRVMRKDLPKRMGHQSEQESDYISSRRTIKNNGTIGELKTAVDSILANYDPTR